MESTAPAPVASSAVAVKAKKVFPSSYGVA